MDCTSVLPSSILRISMWLSCVLLHKTPFLSPFWYVATAQSMLCSSFTSHFLVPILLSALTHPLFTMREMGKGERVEGSFGRWEVWQRNQLFFANSAHSHDFLWFLSFLYPLIFSKKIPTVCCCSSSIIIKSDRKWKRESVERRFWVWGDRKEWLVLKSNSFLVP